MVIPQYAAAISGIAVATHDSFTRERTIDQHVESAAKLSRVLVFSDVQLREKYAAALNGVVRREDIAFAMYLGEALRIASGEQFDAYVLNLDREIGTEQNLKDGVDLASRITELRGHPELIWLNSISPGKLDEARRHNFGRLYEMTDEPNRYGSWSEFVRHLRSELSDGRRAI